MHPTQQSISNPLKLRKTSKQPSIWIKLIFESIDINVKKVKGKTRCLFVCKEFISNNVLKFKSYSVKNYIIENKLNTMKNCKNEWKTDVIIFKTKKTRKQINICSILNWRFKKRHDKTRHEIDLKCVCVCAETDLKCVWWNCTWIVCWNRTWNMCVEAVPKMCVLKLHLKCLCWNCTQKRDAS